ncbi:MAG: leucine--tRNA ligase [Candidatus Buchananbacteria bacterium]|nr:leucine--tRNA ligase [Candidatus Buchananbacteria bacterium]
MKKYDHSKIEKKWQKFWEDKKQFAADDESSKPKYYCLIEFPYPSGEGLHVGHPRSYTALDILARKRRMQGYNVLYPIGFDAFGLPSENYAIKTGTSPEIITKKNIENFTRQLKSFGFSFDWDRTVTTTDPSYYKWTQWIFLKMYEHDLAYKAKMPINWCVSCKIGLANEEVVNGKCERCGGEVIKKELEQWMFRITRYADRLIDDLETVDYLDRIKQQQINWIGRSEGAEIDFKITGQDHALTVYTTRPDTLFGATFIVIAPEHNLITDCQSQITNLKEVEAYIEQAKKKSDLERTELQKEKTGVVLQGVMAINPVTGKQIPIWVADYVLSSYGTGAIMAVPAHDQRDWEFAQKYHLPIIEVIAGGTIAKQAFVDIETGKLINSGQFNDMSVRQAMVQITKWLEDHGMGRQTVNYKLRDWVFSRQRYWGEPIPMVYCENCKKTGASVDGWVALPESALPLELPKVKNYEPTDTGESPLAAITDWVKTTCPVCGQVAMRETDTMPNWAGSNWYFLRYIDPKNNDQLADKDKLEYFAPVDWYNGGMEHTTLHLLYSRFIYKFLYDIGVVPKKCGNEPYLKRTSHGMILGEGGEKMSKSRGNVVNPDEVVKSVGADTFRVYEMFMGPFDQAIPWDTKGVIGVRRFIEKVWALYTGGVVIVDSVSPELTTLVHKTVKKVSDDIESQDYNTAVSAMMILVNKISEEKAMDQFTAEALVKLLSPFAPHLSEEIWELTGHKGSISQAPWPVFDPALIMDSEIDLIVQVNGKLRDKIRVPADINEQKAEILAKQSEKVLVHLKDREIKNVIFVPGRLINFVV